MTIRSVFIIDPNKKIRLIMSYPASTGRNSAEVLRVVDSLQTGDKHKVTTPINWYAFAVTLGVTLGVIQRKVLALTTVFRVPGNDVIVAPSVKEPDASRLFPNYYAVKPYLRFTPLPVEKTSANV